jgi:hypothetical protein
MKLEIIQAVKAVDEESESVCGDVAREGPCRGQELPTTLGHVHHTHASRCIPFEEPNNKLKVSIWHSVEDNRDDTLRRCMHYDNIHRVRAHRHDTNVRRRRSVVYFRNRIQQVAVEGTELYPAIMVHGDVASACAWHKSCMLRLTLQLKVSDQSGLKHRR